VVEQGVKHKEQFLVHQKLLGEFEVRTGFIEYDLYKSDKKEDRFEEVFRRIAEMEQQRSIDLEAIKLSYR
jgi:quinol monooxygenase YgiN